LLTQQLKIPKENHALFLEYCTTKNISSTLLKEENQFQLLDYLVKYSLEFRDFLDKSAD